MVEDNVEFLLQASKEICQEVNINKTECMDITQNKI
jgi:hypothetical protein